MDFPPLGYFLVIFSGTLLEFQIGRAPPEDGDRKSCYLAPLFRLGI